MIRQYEVGDALKICVQQAQRDEAVVGAKLFDDVGAYSLVNSCGEILAVFGYEADEGEIYCYALISEYVGRKLLEAVRFLHTEIPLKAKQMGRKRVLMTVRKGFSQAERFACLLGFKKGEVLPLFFNGNDYQVFERIL